jgi:hypothetical protein
MSIDALINAVRIHDKIRKAQKSFKTIFGAEYDQQMQPYRSIVKGAMQQHKTDNEMEAAYIVVTESDKPDTEGAALFQLKILAAAADIIDQKHA